MHWIRTVIGDAGANTSSSPTEVAAATSTTTLKLQEEDEQEPSIADMPTAAAAPPDDEHLFHDVEAPNMDIFSLEHDGNPIPLSIRHVRLVYPLCTFSIRGFSWLTPRALDVICLQDLPKDCVDAVLSLLPPSSTCLDPSELENMMETDRLQIASYNPVSLFRALYRKIVTGWVDFKEAYEQNCAVLDAQKIDNSRVGGGGAVEGIGTKMSSEDWGENKSVAQSSLGGDTAHVSATHVERNAALSMKLAKTMVDKSFDSVFARTATKRNLNMPEALISVANLYRVMDVNQVLLAHGWRLTFLRTKRRVFGSVIISFRVEILKYTPDGFTQEDEEELQCDYKVVEQYDGEEEEEQATGEAAAATTTTKESADAVGPDNNTGQQQQPHVSSTTAASNAHRETTPKNSTVGFTRVIRLSFEEALKMQDAKPGLWKPSSSLRSLSGSSREMTENRRNSVGDGSTRRNSMFSGTPPLSKKTDATPSNGEDKLTMS